MHSNITIDEPDLFNYKGILVTQSLSHSHSAAGYSLFDIRQLGEGARRQDRGSQGPSAVDQTEGQGRTLLSLNGKTCARCERPAEDHPPAQPGDGFFIGVAHLFCNHECIPRNEYGAKA